MKLYKILITLLCLFLIPIYSFAHGGNITGWKDKNSDKIVLHDNKYYGYHNEDGQRHYHQVEWDEEKQRWVIIAPAVYYDENFNVISNNNDDNNTEKIEVTLADTVDGDTAKFIMNDKEITVRFLGIDTPETVKPNTPVQPFGKEASDFTKNKLTSASKIEIEFDENSDQKDKYDRYLAWVWVDGELIQNLIIKEGLAKTYMLQNNYKYAGILQTSEYEAQNSKIGIWSQETDSNNNSVNNVNSNNISTATSDTVTLGTIIVAIVIFILTSLKIIKKRK